MQPERAELYFQQGSSDKVYHLQLEGAQDQWAVQAQWGRRGSALQSDVKVSGTSYEEAKRVYDRILREKTGKGYLNGPGKRFPRNVWVATVKAANGRRLDVPVAVVTAEGYRP